MFTVAHCGAIAKIKTLAVANPMTKSIFDRWRVKNIGDTVSFTFVVSCITEIQAKVASKAVTLDGTLDDWNYHQA